MKLYVYETETKEIIAIFEGDSNEDCETQAEENFNLADGEYSATYTPAFGAVDGLNWVCREV